MDANEALPFCEIAGCRWRVLAGEDERRRCPDHGGDPVFAYQDDEFGTHVEYRRPDPV